MRILAASLLFVAPCILRGAILDTWGTTNAVNDITTNAPRLISIAGSGQGRVFSIKRSGVNTDLGYYWSSDHPFLTNSINNYAIEYHADGTIGYGTSGLNTNILLEPITGDAFFRGDLQAIDTIKTTTYYGSGSQLSNVLSVRWEQPDLDGANSNLTVSFEIPAMVVNVTNNITLTNFSRIATNTTRSTCIYLKPTGTWSLLVPSYGANYGIVWHTNAYPGFNRIFTSLTNGSTYVLSITSEGTNLYPSMTEWKP